MVVKKKNEYRHFSYDFHNKWVGIILRKHFILVVQKLKLIGIFMIVKNHMSQNFEFSNNMPIKWI